MSGTAHVVELTAGVVNELARQSGYKFMAHPHGLMQTGSGFIQAAAVAASAGKATTLSTVTATAMRQDISFRQAHANLINANTVKENISCSN